MSGDKLDRLLTSAKGDMDIHLSSRNGHLYIVKFLVEKCSVDVNVTTNGMTPEQLAKRQGHDEVVQYLQKMSKTSL